MSKEIPAIRGGIWFEVARERARQKAGMRWIHWPPEKRFYKTMMELKKIRKSLLLQKAKEVR